MNSEDGCWRMRLAALKVRCSLCTLLTLKVGCSLLTDFGCALPPLFPPAPGHSGSLGYSCMWLRIGTGTWMLVCWKKLHSFLSCSPLARSRPRSLTEW